MLRREWLAPTAVAVLLQLTSVTLADSKPGEVENADAETKARIDKVILLGRLAGVYQSSGDAATGRRSIDAAVEEVGRLKEGVVADWAKNKMATDLAGVGQFDRAEKLARSITDPALAADTFAKLGEKFSKAGEKQRSKAALEEATGCVGRIKQPAEQVAASIPLAGALAKTGDPAAAKALLDTAIKTADALKDTTERIDLRSELAGNYVKAGDKDRAMQIFNENLKAVPTVADGATRSQLYIHLAGEHAENGERKRAGEILKLATDEAEKLPVSPVRDRRFAEIVWNLSQAGEFEAAEKLAGKVSDSQIRAVALARAAGNAGRGGQKEKAVELLRSAQRLGGDVKSSLGQAEILITVAANHQKAKTGADTLPMLAEAAKLLSK